MRNVEEISMAFDITMQVRAAVHHWQDADSGSAYCLQIELGNDRAIVLTVTEKDPPSVSVWTGSGEHSFVGTDIERGETLDSFRQFVADAFEP
jgi:hypothetical protein